ncbi:MAG: hypothetical protein MK212_19775 [Saprospiraceae bacterium]|nr:hypothetical protein [Saprospiraceae bacterium]
MSIKLNNMWFSLVEIKPNAKNTILGEAEGGFVNVAYKADSKEELIQKLKETFLENDFLVVNVHEIENINSLSIDDFETSEKKELFLDILEDNYDFSWGVFHIWDD